MECSGPARKIARILSNPLSARSMLIGIRMTAEERATELMSMQRSKRPDLLKQYVCERFDTEEMCFELWMWAMSSYAQCIEGLVCTDELYRASRKDCEWFAKFKPVSTEYDF